MNNPLDNVPVFCVICGQEVPIERKRKRSVTCCDEHSHKRKNYLRERKEMRKCKYCGTPSSPEERKDFIRWRRERGLTNTGKEVKVKELTT